MIKYLRFTLSVLASLFLASCGSRTNGSGATVSAEKTHTTSREHEAETLQHVNRYRATKGLPKLQTHPGLAKMALAHSQTMTARGEMGHFEFEKRAKKAQNKFNMGAMSENLHQSWGIVPTGQSIANQWANSSKHRENMEGRFNYAGMGIVRTGDNIYTTLLLGAGKGQSSPSGSPAPFLHL